MTPRVPAAIALAALLLAGCTPTISGEAQPEGEVAVVEWVYDGDTIRVDLVGESTRVRLLNVDAPEEPREGQPGECLAAEATALLIDLLPEGGEVVLVYDDVERDRYGRLLAGVYADGVLVNAELARAGLARPVVFDGNVRFLAEVEDALAEAEDAGAGMFDPAADCPF